MTRLARPDLERRPARPADSGLVVVVRDDERVDGALQRFAKLIGRSGLLGDLRHHRAGMSKGERRRAKRKEARQRRLRERRRRESRRRQQIGRR